MSTAVVKLGDVIQGVNLIVVTCPGCQTTTVLTPAGGNIRDCAGDCQAERSTPVGPNHRVQHFLLQGADCTLVRDGWVLDVFADPKDDENPDVARPGQWEQG